MTLLSVNLNKVALVRNARRADLPSVLAAARVCVDAGAGGITVHPRPDERHTRVSDVRELSAFVRGETDVELNIEGNPFPDFVELARETLPTPEPIERAKDLGADRIELYTEPYARSFGSQRFGPELERFARAAEKANEVGLGVNAGHDLALDNLGPFCRAVPRVLEVSIGHALVSHALAVGLGRAVRDYLQVLRAA